MNIIIYLLINYLGFTIGPARVDKALFGPEEITELFEVRNFSNDSLRFRIEFEDFDIDEYGKVTFFNAGSLSNSVASHCIINPEEFYVRPQGIEVIRLTFRPPQLAKISEYYGMLLFKSQPIPTQYRPSIAVAGEIGVPLYFSVADLVIKDAFFESLTVVGDSVAVVFRNASNVHLRVRGEACLLKYDETLIKKDSIPEFVVMPSRIRRLNLPLGEVLEKGSYIMRVRFDYGAVELIEGERRFTR